jgi:four helix bundle protein
MTQTRQQNSGPVFDHERLDAYRESIRFVAWASEMLFNLESKAAAKDQMDRAATSVPLNLAEGNGKRSARDRARFFEIARGSALECATCLDVLVARGLLLQATAQEGKGILLSVVSLIHGLLRYLEGRVGEECPEYAAPSLPSNAAEQEQE